MVAPSHKTPNDLAGKWDLNKSLSDDITPVLVLQDTNTLLRQSNLYGIEQTATFASIPGTIEQYILDYEGRQNHDAFFGDVNGRSKWITIGGATKDRPDAKGDWEQGDGKLIVAEGGKPNESGTAIRIWRSEEVGGARRYTQRVKVWNKSGQEMKFKMVYDFAGEET